jgi:hypothetical protein
MVPFGRNDCPQITPAGDMSPPEMRQKRMPPLRRAVSCGTVDQCGCERGKDCVKLREVGTWVEEA